MPTDNGPPERDGISGWKVRHLRRYYGLSHKDYQALHVQQEGKCAICRQADQRLVIDHLHSDPGTRIATRGLLCFWCNTALGWYEQFLNPKEWQQLASAYLATPPIFGRANETADTGGPRLADARQRMRRQAKDTATYASHWRRRPKRSPPASPPISPDDMEAAMRKIDAELAARRDAES
jgi:hypothetical protein